MIAAIRLTKSILSAGNPRVALQCLCDHTLLVQGGVVVPSTSVVDLFPIRKLTRHWCLWFI